MIFFPVSAINIFKISEFLKKPYFLKAINSTDFKLQFFQLDFLDSIIPSFLSIKYLLLMISKYLSVLTFTLFDSFISLIKFVL